MSDIKKELFALAAEAHRRLTSRLEGMSDDEYFWEPVPDCWNVRPNGDGTMRGDWGLVFDEDPPLTTIAWRMAHIFDCLTGERCATLLGLEPEPPLGGLPATADAARETLERAYTIWRGYLEKADEAALWDKLGPVAGPYAEDTRLAFVLHIIDEYIHHGAEVALMRDLYRARQPEDAFILACLRADRAQVDALRAANPNVVAETIGAEPDLMVRASATGRWDAVPLLAELGFPVNGSKGRGPLHHAAAVGRVDLVRLLIDLGADVEARDAHYNATPLQWAEYFSRTEAADYLRSRGTPAAR